MAEQAQRLTESSDDERTEALLAEYDEERPARRLSGVPLLFVRGAGVGLSLYALLWVFRPLSAQQYRTSFLAVALPLTLLAYRGWPRRDRQADTSDNPGILDWLLAALALVALAYPLVVFDEFVRRAVRPETLDIVFGVVTTLLVLEATRRTVGWILPAVCLGFLAYAYLGGLIPAGYLFGHPGYDTERLVGSLYMGLEGLFGVPLDVAATYIVLFTIYGAVLEYSGAGRYFIDVSFAAFRQSRTAPGRTVTLAGFLLGTVSGSGVATTVSLGSVAWPILRRAGYPPANGGGVLAAAGIGAILSPPTLGAAAFIIAEFLGVTYLRVLLWATIPTLLYYLGIILAIEIDARRFGTQSIALDTPPLRHLLLRYGYHFSSLFLIVVLMAFGLSPFRAVTYATLAAFALSFLSPADRLTPRKAWDALAAGALGVLPVAATCAAAGIIVGVTTLTGLGLKVSSIIVTVAGGSLVLTALFSAVAVLVLGLAVPVTASFIIAAVIVGPALTALGVEPFAAYMFIFYYAVLSEVSPPTALSAVAASAITGANAFGTMMRTWRYTLPAFLVPFAFVLSPNGEGVLGVGSPSQIALTLLVSAVAVAALAVVTGGWMIGPARWPERAVCAVAAVLLLYLEPAWVLAGLGALAVGIALHLLTRRRALTV
jgi:TRAP transporter 4TM/12TM fusion protein